MNTNNAKKIQIELTFKIQYHILVKLAIYFFDEKDVKSYKSVDNNCRF